MVVKNKYIVTGLSIMLSIFCTAVLTSIEFSSYGILLSGGVITQSFMVLVFFSLFYLTLFLQPKKRELVYSFCFALLCSFILVVGIDFCTHQEITPVNGSKTIIFILCFLSLTAVTILSLRALSKIPTPRNTHESSFIMTDQKNSHLESFLTRVRKSNKMKFFILLLSLLLLWLPAYFALYPGMMQSDLLSQLQYYSGELPWTTHHPVLHTFLFGSLVFLGNLFGSLEFGVAIYFIFQSFIMAILLSLTYLVIEKTTDVFIIRVLTFSFFAFTPVIQFFIFSASKDTLFAGFFLLTAALATLMALRPDAFFSSKYNCILLILASSCVCLFRNQGILVIVIFFLISTIILSKYRKKIAILASISVATFLIITLSLSAIFGIEKSSAGEAFSVPLQQISRVLTSENGEYSNEQKAEFLSLFKPEIDLNELYTPTLSDPIKRNLKDNFDIALLLKLWISLGIDNPKIYLEDFCFQTIGYWYPDYDFSFNRAIYYDGTENIYKYINVERTPLFSFYDQYLRWAVHSNDVPLLSLVNCMAFPTFTIFFLVFVLIYFKNTKPLIPVALFLSLFLTLLLGPASLYRYCFPLVLCIPVIFLLILKANNKADGVR